MKQNNNSEKMIAVFEANGCTRQAQFIGRNISMPIQVSGQDSAENDFLTAFF